MGTRLRFKRGETRPDKINEIVEKDEPAMDRPVFESESSRRLGQQNWPAAQIAFRTFLVIPVSSFGL